MSTLGDEASSRRGRVLLQLQGLELLLGVAAKQRDSHHSGGCFVYSWGTVASCPFGGGAKIYTIMVRVSLAHPSHRRMWAYTTRALHIA